MINLKQLFCNHFGCVMVIAGSNTFYMKIEDKNIFSVTSWYSGPAGIVVSLGDIHLTPYLTNKNVS